MEFRNPYLTNKHKLDLLARWIIVHSIIYYLYDANIVSDYMFDMNCRQFYQLRKSDPEAFKLTSYKYCMKDFNGKSGYDLPKKLYKKDREYLGAIAEHLLIQNQKYKMEVEQIG